MTRDERNERIAALTEEGASIRAIAESIGVSTGTVVRTRAKLGISRPSAQRMGAEEIHRGQAMIDDGIPLAEVARTLGRDLRTISSNFPTARRTDRAERARLAHMSRQFSELGKKTERDGFASG